MVDDPNADAKAAEEKRRAKQEEINKKAAEVMENSKPTPTQEEADLAKLGLLHPDDRVDPENPEMPSLEEQRKVEPE